MMAGDQSSHQLASKTLSADEPRGENNWLDEIRDLYYDPSGDTAFSS